MVPDCTLTTSCYDLTRFHKQSRTLTDSINNMRTLLEVPCYLVIYTDNACIDIIKEIRNSFQLDHLTQYVVIEFEQLPYYKYVDVIKSNREKYWPSRDERTCAENHMLVCSKMFFTLQTIEKNPFHTSKFGWIDSNLNTNCSKICEDYNETILMNILHNVSDKFHIQILNVNDKKYKNDEHKREYYDIYRWVVCGSFYTTGKEIGIKVLNKLHDIFESTTALGYGHGEEMLYLEILDEFYDDIDRGYGDYGQILNNYFTPTRNIHYIYYQIIKRYLEYSYYKECYDCCKAVLHSIENMKIECSYDIYMGILFSYYVSSYYYNQSHSLQIIQHIYDVCSQNNVMKVEFDKNKDLYESQFKYCNGLKQNYKLIINIFGCPTIEKYKQEILKINETWGKKAEEMGIKILFFFGEEKTDLVDDNKYIYLQGISNNYESAAYKQNLGLKYIYENYNADFIFTCGTDTYINIPRLLVYIETMDKNAKLYIGGHGDYRMIGKQNIYFHSGGAGFVITNHTLGQLYSRLSNIQEEWIVVCNENNVVSLIPACDVMIGYYASLMNIETIMCSNFYGCNYKGLCYNNTFDCCSKKINIREIISCHRMTNDDFDEYTKILEQNNYYIV
jgi:hypothetical protein